MQSLGNAGDAPMSAAIQTPRTSPHGSERSRVIDRLERIITQDLGGRGLAVDPGDNLVTRCRGNLGRAARHLAAEGGRVAIVTGFYVAAADPPAIETDGPAGAVALAWLLTRMNLSVSMLTDALGAPVLEAGIEAAGIDRARIALAICPLDSAAGAEPAPGADPDSFAERFFRSGPGAQLTHLIAIERAGPAWTPQPDWTAEDTAEFIRLCPPDHHGEVHNFRGRIISPQTGPLHRLFDFVRQNDLPIRTIGIGDGGNEIGMGSIPWQVVHANIPSGLGARIACRVPTDWTIACGVSNWGAYALAAAVAHLRDQPKLLHEWSDARERRVLSAMVDAGAVDGVTAQRTLTVDGLDLAQHLAIWKQIRAACQSEV